MTAQVDTRRPFLIAIESHNRLSLEMETSSVNLARDNGGALKRRLLDGHTSIHSFNSHGAGGIKSYDSLPGKAIRHRPPIAADFLGGSSEKRI